MNFSKTINEISSQLPEHGLAYSLSKQLESYKGNEYTDEEFLENLNDLMYWLYILDKKMFCINLQPIYNEIGVTSNKNIWTWVESSLILLCRIYKELNKYNEAENCLNKVKSAFNIGSELAVKVNNKTRSRRLSGEGLYYKDIEEAKQSSDNTREVAYRIIQLKRLCYIKELGGSNEFPEPKAEAEIQENLNALKKLSFFT
jgi:hypothetical protein